MRSHHDPIRTCPLNDLLQDLGHDHSRRDRDGQMIGDSTSPRVAETRDHPNGCCNSAEHMAVCSPGGGSGNVLDGRIRVPGCCLRYAHIGRARRNREMSHVSPDWGYVAGSDRRRRPGSDVPIWSWTACLELNGLLGNRRTLGSGRRSNPASTVFSDSCVLRRSGADGARPSRRRVRAHADLRDPAPSLATHISRRRRPPAGPKARSRVASGRPVVCPRHQIEIPAATNRLDRRLVRWRSIRGGVPKWRGSGLFTCSASPCRTLGGPAGSAPVPTQQRLGSVPRCAPPDGGD
jgi:hypothetical protein